jgi:hypothetical protein
MSIKSEVKNWDFSALVPFGGNTVEFNEIVPTRCLMVLKSFGNTCGTLLAWGTVYWVFLVDGYPAYPYNRIFDQLGFETGRQDIQGIEVGGGHTAQIIAYNPTAADCRLGISLTYELQYLDQ